MQVCSLQQPGKYVLNVHDGFDNPAGILQNCKETHPTTTVHMGNIAWLNLNPDEL